MLLAAETYQKMKLAKSTNNAGSLWAQVGGSGSMNSLNFVWTET